jgi:hypothetical protein
MNDRRKTSRRKDDVERLDTQRATEKEMLRLMRLLADLLAPEQKGLN